MALGTPSIRPADAFDHASPLDRLARAIPGGEWACLVLAEPVDERPIRDLRADAIRESRIAMVEQQSGGEPAPLAQYYLELLGTALKTLGAGLEIGFWRTGIYLLRAGDACNEGVASQRRGLSSLTPSHSREVPFLVLEPAKTEYRDLLNDPELCAALQVFTLGSELIAPFRLNPFEVVGCLPIGVHIDLLRSVFTASFGMWQPLPQIVEQALHAIYRDRGWDVATNTNHRLDAGTDSADAFPTLSDLTAKAEEVIQTLGYDGKVTDDLRAALLTRLNGLRAGGKGVMLDVQRSFPMDRLLARPTVLELQSMGDDDDKAFVLGLLLVRLYKYRRAGGPAADLQHLIVFEEAHRLLANVAPQDSAIIINILFTH